MTDRRQRQPAKDEAPRAILVDAAVLTAPRQRAMPEPPYLKAKDPQRVLVPGHPVAPEVSTRRLEPRAQFGDGFVHRSLKLGFHLVKLRLQAFADGLPQYRVHPGASPLRADMRKAKNVERLRFPFSASLPILDRKRSKLERPRSLGMRFQVELPHSLLAFRPKLIGIRLAVKSNHDVSRSVGVPDRVSFAAEYPARTSPVNPSTPLCERLRMLRGRQGSLIHCRVTFAFTTPRRLNRRTGETP
jgi:hypothetical protein